MVELNFGHCRSGAPDVPGRGVNQQVLSGPVKSVLAGDVRGVQEGAPSKLVHLRVIDSLSVGCHDANVVSGMTDERVD